MSLEAKRILPRVQSLMGSSKSCSQLKEGMRGYELENEDNGVKLQLDHTEASNESNCMCLSSNRRSPSWFLYDNSPYAPEFSCLNLSLQGCSPSVLSVSINSSIILDKNSGLSLADETSMFLCKLRDGLQQKLLHEKVAMWLHNAAAGKAVDSFFGRRESGDSSYENSLCDESSTHESSCTSLSTCDDSPTYVRDFVQMDTWVSLIDIESEESELLQDTWSGFDVFGSDFPSPYRASRHIQIGSDDCNPSEGSAADEPLFWPFDPSSYCGPDFDKKFLCMSPLKDVRNIGIRRLSHSKSIMLWFHQKHDPPLGSKKMQRGCRSLTSSSTPNLATAGNKTVKLDKNDFENVKTTPSRFSRSTDQVLLEQRRSHQLLTRRPKHRGDLRLRKCVPEVEVSGMQDMASVEVSIEEMVGLNEFDGHEGIQSY